VDVADRIAEEADRSGNDRGSLERMRAAEGKTGGHADRKVGHPDLELEWARLPADVSCSYGRKKQVVYGSPNPRKANRE
jgi:hypothetical protein